MVLAVLVVAGCVGGPEPVPLSYFYFPGCPTCTETARLEQLADELIQAGRAHGGMTVRIHDIRDAESSAQLRRLGAEYGVDVDGLRFPIVFVAGRVYDGFEDIQAYVDSVGEGIAR